MKGKIYLDLYLILYYNIKNKYIILRQQQLLTLIKMYGGDGRAGENTARRD